MFHMKKEDKKELVISLIGVSIGAWIAGYYLAHMPWGIKRFAIMLLIYTISVYLVSYSYKGIEKYILKRHKKN